MQTPDYLQVTLLLLMAVLTSNVQTQARFAHNQVGFTALNLDLWSPWDQALPKQLAHESSQHPDCDHPDRSHARQDHHQPPHESAMKG